MLVVPDIDYQRNSFDDSIFHSRISDLVIGGGLRFRKMRAMLTFGARYCISLPYNVASPQSAHNRFKCRLSVDKKKKAPMMAYCQLRGPPGILRIRCWSVPVHSAAVSIHAVPVSLHAVPASVRSVLRHH